MLFIYRFSILAPSFDVHVHSFYGDHPKFPTKNLSQPGRKENGYAYGDCVLVSVCCLSMCWVGELFEDVSLFFASFFFLGDDWLCCYGTGNQISMVTNDWIWQNREVFKEGSDCTKWGKDTDCWFTFLFSSFPSP